MLTRTLVMIIIFHYRSNSDLMIHSTNTTNNIFLLAQPFAAEILQWISASDTPFSRRSLSEWHTWLSDQSKHFLDLRRNPCNVESSAIQSMLTIFDNGTAVNYLQLSYYSYS